MGDNCVGEIFTEGCILIFGFKYIIQKRRNFLQIAEKQFKLRKEGTNKS